MISKALRIARTSIPTLDDWIKSMITALVAATCFAIAAVVPDLIQKPADVIAHTFGVMSVYRLIGVSYQRTLRHAVDFIKFRLGIKSKQKKKDDTIGAE